MSLKNSEEENASPDKKPSEDRSSPESDLEVVKEDYDQLCRELNMDESTMDTAWRSYIAIRHNYTLEVNFDTEMSWNVQSISQFVITSQLVLSFCQIVKVLQ